MLVIAPALPRLTARPARTTLLILSETSMNDRDAAFVRNSAKGERDTVTGVSLARINTTIGQVPRTTPSPRGGHSGCRRDCRKLWGQAAIAIGGYGSLVGWNFSPKSEPRVPFYTA
jgi:hypothetical protein